MQFKKAAIRAASGCFISDDPPQEFMDSESHPISLVIKGTVEQRRNQFLHSPFVDGILFIHDNILMSLNLQILEFDVSNDPTCSLPLISGAVGAECLAALPGYITLEDLVSDAYFLGDEEAKENANFTFGQKLPETLR